MAARGEGSLGFGQRGAFPSKLDQYCAVRERKRPLSVRLHGEGVSNGGPELVEAFVIHADQPPLAVAVGNPDAEDRGSPSSARPDVNGSEAATKIAIAAADIVRAVRFMPRISHGQAVPGRAPETGTFSPISAT